MNRYQAAHRTLCRSSPKGIPCLRVSLQSRNVPVLSECLVLIRQPWLPLSTHLIIACSTILKKGENGGRVFNSVCSPGFTALRSAGALSYMKNTFSSSGRRRHNSRVHWSPVCSCLQVGLYDASDHVLSRTIINRIKLINIHAWWLHQN